MTELLATREDVTSENLLKEINFLAHSAGVDAWVRDRLQKMHRVARQLLAENERLRRANEAQRESLTVAYNTISDKNLRLINIRGVLDADSFFIEANGQSSDL